MKKEWRTRRGWDEGRGGGPLNLSKAANLQDYLDQIRSNICGNSKAVDWTRTCGGHGAPGIEKLSLYM